MRTVHLAAFPTPAEADLVDRLRAIGAVEPRRSLLAEVDGAVVGHCLLTQTTLERPDGSRSIGPVVALGPIAVLPVWQHRGVGTMLMWAAIERCADDGAAAIVLASSPTYYLRFGFVPALEVGLAAPDHWPPGVWLARLPPAWAPQVAGVVRYALPFMELD